MIFPFRDNIGLLRAPLVTWLLIAINVIVFLTFLTRTPEEQAVFELEHGFVPARVNQLFTHQPLVVPVDLAVEHPHGGAALQAQAAFRFQPSATEIIGSMFTCLFLHGGWVHLLGNMWFLYLFGDNVEDRLGRISFLIFYLLGGLLATLCHWFSDPASHLPIIGASGAIAAVLGAFAVTWPWARIRSLVFLVFFVTVIDLPALLVLGMWFVTQLVEAREGLALGIDGGVAWWAHVGGFVAGAAIMPWISHAPHDDHELSL